MMSSQTLDDCATDLTSLFPLSLMLFRCDNFCEDDAGVNIFLEGSFLFGNRD